MSRIEKFGEFTSEGFDSFMSKQRRIVTGASAGEEIHKLSEEQQQELIDLYIKDPNEAAKYLRSIIVREKNKQFGLGLALTVAGATMIYKAMNVDPPKPPPHPHEDGKFASVDDGVTQTINKYTGSNLNPKSSPEEFVQALKDFGQGDANKGIEYLTKGMSGSDKTEMVTTLKSIVSDPYQHGNTLAKMFSGDWAGTGKSAGDLLDWPVDTKVWIPNPKTID